MIKILHFYADWCEDCDDQNDVLEQLLDEVDDVVVELVNVDYQEKRAKKYEIITIPTLVVEMGDDVVTKIEGVVSFDELLTILGEVFGDIEDDEDYIDFGEM